MFQRRHYQAIADTIAREKDRTLAYRMTWSLAGTFAEDNPRFDLSRFLQACKSTEELAGEQAYWEEQEELRQT